MITFEQARAIAASSPEVLGWFPPGHVEIAEWGSATGTRVQAPAERSHRVAWPLTGRDLRLGRLPQHLQSTG